MMVFYDPYLGKMIFSDEFYLEMKKQWESQRDQNIHEYMTKSNAPIDYVSQSTQELIKLSSISDSLLVKELAKRLEAPRPDDSRL